MRKVEADISILKLDYSKITNILFTYPFLTVTDFEKKIG
jgi:hypothetical protein